MSGSDYVHPHDPRWSEGLVYISDSCRAWRDEALIDLVGDRAAERVLLNLHGELWLDSEVEDRVDYLRTVSTPTASAHADSYFNECMASIWTSHEAVRLDAERIRRSTEQQSDPDGGLDGGDELEGS